MAPAPATLDAIKHKKGDKHYRIEMIVATKVNVGSLHLTFEKSSKMMVQFLGDNTACGMIPFYFEEVAFQRNKHVEICNFPGANFQMYLPNR